MVHLTDELVAAGVQFGQRGPQVLEIAMARRFPFQIALKQTSALDL